MIIIPFRTPLTYVIRLALLHHVVVVRVVVSPVDVVGHLRTESRECSIVFRFQKYDIFGQNMDQKVSIQTIFRPSQTCNSSASSVHVSVASPVVQLALSPMLLITGEKESWNEGRTTVHILQGQIGNKAIFY